MSLFVLPHRDSSVDRNIVSEVFNSNNSKIVIILWSHLTSMLIFPLLVYSYFHRTSVSNYIIRPSLCKLTGSTVSSSGEYGFVWNSCTVLSD